MADATLRRKNTSILVLSYNTEITHTIIITLCPRSLTAYNMNNIPSKIISTSAMFTCVLKMCVYSLWQKNVQCDSKEHIVFISDINHVNLTYMHTITY